MDYYRQSKNRLSQDEIQILINKDPDGDFDKRIPDSERAIIQRGVKKLLMEELQKKGLLQGPDEFKENEWLTFGDVNNTVQTHETEEDKSEKSVEPFTWNNTVHEVKSDHSFDSRQNTITNYLNCLDQQPQDNSFIDPKEEDYFAKAINVGVYASRTPLSFPTPPERLEKKEIIDPQDEINMNTDVRAIDYGEKPLFSHPYHPPTKDLRKTVKEKAQTELKKLFDTFPMSLSFEHRLEQSRMLMAKRCISDLLKP
ncbi:uncharacterized protein LOC106670940 isoform X2 [Cimex lectularius]|uniref:Uncharacterized protein n=1 Tax=Cimex lectularius TaxID=79782 RepID=A0A8I6SC35_CIMLE|nr:uncharacterized protein LOC106670940 isoform X2 [Cimex lectularius]